VDAVHIRCPNNISIPGLVALQRTILFRQALYTGSWQKHAGEPVSYSLQRFYLKHFFQGPVAVYGDWSNQPAHIIPSFSPSYSIADWNQELDQVADRLQKLEASSQLLPPIHLVTVGSLNGNKNQQLIIKVVHELKIKGLSCILDILGDGDERINLEKLVLSLGLGEEVFFHGSVPHELVRQYYRKADFVIQAPYSEGFGKVPLEAMFHGAIPILSDVDISSQMIGGVTRGRCFPQGDLVTLGEIIEELVHKPVQMAALIRNGREYARNFTLEAWRNHLITTLNKYWHTNLSDVKSGG
jgi:glycosyltransferase involved in cell wall biosynthesis